MDKNTLTGFLLIALIIGGFYFFTRPSEEQIKAREEQQARLEMEMQRVQENQNAAIQENILSGEKGISDSTSTVKYSGPFANAKAGEETFQQVESELLRVTFSNKGGRISTVELKNYRTHDSLPLILFDGEKEGNYGFTLATIGGEVLNTTELFFEPLPVVKNETAQIITMRLRADSASYLDFVYTIPNDDYMTNFDIIPVNMGSVLSPSYRELEMQWTGKIRQQEKGKKFESRYSQLYYKHLTDDVEHLSESKTEKKYIPNRVKWIAFKDQFFSTVLIADEYFSSPDLESVVTQPSSPYLKEYFAKTSVPFNAYEGKTGFRFYFGPNHFQTLNQYNKGVDKEDKLELEKLVYLGWSLFRWINRIFVIPMFNFFGGFIANFGIVILLMTLVIKLILLPLTYKSYMSSAKMRVLKPEIEKINEKIPATKPQERQKATMELYSRAGVNPMGGCLPMLLQMPVLIALFQFFPSAIELRQKSFLWAKDLSSYDAIISWDAHIPLLSDFYGNHISLFCLLMTIVNIFYTKINMATQDMGNQQMPGMKYIMYMMPLMFLFFFNDYASGLSYYYLVSTLLTILQTYIIRASVDEEKLLKQLTDNKKKPAKKGWMARMTEQAQQQQKAQLNQQKGKKK